MPPTSVRGRALCVAPCERCSNERRFRASVSRIHELIRILIHFFNQSARRYVKHALTGRVRRTDVSARDTIAIFFGPLVPVVHLRGTSRMLQMSRRRA